MIYDPINTWGPKRSRLWIARYLMKFTMHFPCPCTSGIVLHAEALRLLPGRDSQPAQVLCNVIYWFGKTTKGLYGLRFGSDESAQFSNWRLCPPSHRQTSAAQMALPFGWNAGLALPLYWRMMVLCPSNIYWQRRWTHTRHGDMASAGNPRMDKPSKGTCSRVKD